MKPPLRNWSLRNRLTVGVVLLSALGFIGAGLVVQRSIESYLIYQIDSQLSSISGVVELQLDRAGIAGEPHGSESYRVSLAPNAVTTPLQRVPTSISVTLLDPLGNVVGRVGGDFNINQITDYVQGMLMSDISEHGDKPFTIEAYGSGFRVLTRVLPSSLGSAVIAQSLDDFDKTTDRIGRVFFFIGLIVLLLITLAARQVIRIGLKPLDYVEKTAEKIALGDLTARLPDAKPDTEVGKLVRSLNQMLSRIEESFAIRRASEAKLRRFVADASHELRTPLTAIRGFAELHRQGAVAQGAETAELLGRIEKESIRMGALVEDLLLLARLDQPREIESKPVDLTHIVQDAIASAQVTGEERLITLTAPLELGILGDSDRIYQVITNLLANAHAHTPAGTPITVEVAQNEAEVTVSIADLGPGLSEQDQVRIFERFYRVDPSRQRNGAEGSGLGLSIVEATMRAHGGSVSVQSELGRGAVFTLHFPRMS